MKIVDFPLTKISFCFVAGILLAHYWLPSFGILSLFLIISTVAFLGSYFLISNKKIDNYYFGVATWILSFMVGIVAVFVHNNRFDSDNYSNKIKDFEKKHIIELVLREKLKTSNQNYRFVALVKKIDSKT